MSTKSTIAHDDNFHFYREEMDEDHVYLELQTNEFVAGYGRVMLPIPLHIWETIRQLGAADLSLADKADEDLLRIVESEVDRRITDYRARDPNDPGANLIRYAGLLVYGTADSPREKQIETGMLYFDEERARQRDLRDAIETLRGRAWREQASPTNGPAS